MRVHPALLMIVVWGLGGLAFIVLPYEFLTKKFSLYGALILVLFIATFCIGSISSHRLAPKKIQPSRPPSSTSKIGLFLATISAVASICLAIDLFFFQEFGFNLSEAYSNRSGRAQAVLQGEALSSSLFFKFGFLTYPVSYVYLVWSIIYSKRTPIWLIVAFGILPAILAAMVLGGRTSIFSTMLYFLLAVLTRGAMEAAGRKRGWKKYDFLPKGLILLAIALFVVGVIYFVNVFIVRASFVGGTDEMLKLAGQNWGVTFNEDAANRMESIFGVKNTYLIFVFSWYYTQGELIASIIFSEYSAGPMLGSYGVDVIAAFWRQIDIGFMPNSNEGLIEIGTYGFFPSAFGSLYVDFLFGGLLVTFFWGWASGYVFRNARRGDDTRWRLITPFVTFGILLSLVNTPIGFSNGFITYFWLFVCFLGSKR
ncbi:oligosaccharide repeat unit polymerase [Maritalea sp. S77]|uniref:oligosaccharide repeat unit polymerase n=1 Tax=Maritalea sp. S77 TaxID=3415125 RepID=UPI003C7DD8D7